MRVIFKEKHFILSDLFPRYWHHTDFSFSSEALDNFLQAIFLNEIFKAVFVENDADLQTTTGANGDARLPLLLAASVLPYLLQGYAEAVAARARIPKSMDRLHAAVLALHLLFR